MISSARRERTMSTSPPPQVELIRPETANTLSGTSSTRPPAMMPPTWAFLENATTSGWMPSCWYAHGVPGGADPGLHLVQDEQRIVGVHELEHGLQELRPHVVVAALALDRLGDERGDVVRVLGERPLGLLQRALLGGDHLVEMITERDG